MYSCVHVAAEAAHFSLKKVSGVVVLFVICIA